MLAHAESERKRRVRVLAGTSRRIHSIAIDLLWRVVTVRDTANATAILARLDRSPRLGSLVRAVVVRADWDTLERVEEAIMADETETFRLDRRFARSGSPDRNYLHLARREWHSRHAADDESDGSDRDEPGEMGDHGSSGSDDDSDSSADGSSGLDDDSDSSDAESETGSAHTVATATLQDEAEFRVRSERTEASASALTVAVGLILGRCWRIELLSIAEPEFLPAQTVPSLRHLDTGELSMALSPFLVLNPSLSQLRAAEDGHLRSLAGVSRLVLTASASFRGSDSAPKLTHLEVGFARDMSTDPPFSISRDAITTLRKLVLNCPAPSILGFDAIGSLLQWLPRTPLECLTVAFGPHDVVRVGGQFMCLTCLALHALRVIMNDGSILIGELVVADPYRPEPRPYSNDAVPMDQHAIQLEAMHHLCTHLGVKFERIDECVRIGRELADTPGCPTRSTSGTLTMRSRTERRRIRHRR